METKDLIIQLKKTDLAKNEGLQQELEDQIKILQGDITSLQEQHKKIEQQIEDIMKADVPEGKPTCQFSESSSYLPEHLIKRANRWICEHEIHHHPNHFFGYASAEPLTKAGPIDYPNYELSISPTQVGDLAGIVCTTCKRLVLRCNSGLYPTDKEKEQYYKYLGEI